MENENKRGGARPGAGRKPIEHKRITVTIRLSEEAYKVLCASDNRSKYVEKLLLQDAAT